MAHAAVNAIFNPEEHKALLQLLQADRPRTPDTLPCGPTTFVSILSKLGVSHPEACLEKKVCGRETGTDEGGRAPAGEVWREQYY